MSKQINTMLIICHKHKINTKGRDSTLLLCSRYDISETLYFKKYKFYSIFGAQSCAMLKSKYAEIWLHIQGRIRYPMQL